MTNYSELGEKISRGIFSAAASLTVVATVAYVCAPQLRQELKHALEKCEQQRERQAIINAYRNSPALPAPQPTP